MRLYTKANGKGYLHIKEAKRYLGKYHIPSGLKDLILKEMQLMGLIKVDNSVIRITNCRFDEESVGNRATVMRKQINKLIEETPEGLFDF